MTALRKHLNRLGSHQNEKPIVAAVGLGLMGVTMAFGTLCLAVQGATKIVTHAGHGFRPK